MGFLSALFGAPKKPPQEEMKLLVQYAQLAEKLGTEQICRGLDESLLPANKDRLSETIALVSLHPFRGLALKSHDLTKLYGLLEFFVRSDELEMINAARELSVEIEDEADATPEQVRTFEAGMRILQNALDEFRHAASKLKKHSASLR